MRVLVVEDEKKTASFIRKALRAEGFAVDVCHDGNDGLHLVETTPYDALVLDIMLPGRDGFELVGLLRQGGRTPIIILTARGQRSDKIRGLNLGADDYITKPFDLEEFLARVHAVLRRAGAGSERLVLGEVVVDFSTRQATRGSRSLHLTHREFELLRYLADRQARVVHRAELLREVWGYPDAPSTRSVDHAVARLRRKIEPDQGEPRFIRTVHGDGYQLTPGE
jgi:DNA-binding response OmpR family regulator